MFWCIFAIPTPKPHREWNEITIRIICVQACKLKLNKYKLLFVRTHNGCSHCDPSQTKHILCPSWNRSDEKPFCRLTTDTRTMWPRPIFGRNGGEASGDGGDGDNEDSVDNNMRPYAMIYTLNADHKIMCKIRVGAFGVLVEAVWEYAATFKQMERILVTPGQTENRRL